MMATFHWTWPSLTGDGHAGVVLATLHSDGHSLLVTTNHLQ